MNVPCPWSLFEDHERDDDGDDDDPDDQKGVREPGRVSEPNQEVRVPLSDPVAPSVPLEDMPPVVGPYVRPGDPLEDTPQIPITDPGVVPPGRKPQDPPFEPPVEVPFEVPVPEIGPAIGPEKIAAFGPPVENALASTVGPMVQNPFGYTPRLGRGLVVRQVTKRSFLKAWPKRNLRQLGDSLVEPLRKGVQIIDLIERGDPAGIKQVQEFLREKAEKSEVQDGGGLKPPPVLPIPGLRGGGFYTNFSRRLSALMGGRAWFGPSY